MSATFKCDFCGATQDAIGTIRFNTRRFELRHGEWSSKWGIDHKFDICDSCMEKVCEALGIDVARQFDIEEVGE